MSLNVDGFLAFNVVLLAFQIGLALGQWRGGPPAPRASKPQKKRPAKKPVEPKTCK